MILLKQSTASQTVQLGPFVDDTDGKTAETGLTIANTDIKINKGTTTQANKNSGGATHIANGWYCATLDATDTDTVGRMQVTVNVSGALPVKLDCICVEEAVYDMLFAASATGYIADQPVNATKISGSATAADNAEVVFATDFATNYNTTNDKWQVNSDLHASAATAAELAKVPKSDGSTSWNATALAAINAEVDAALNTAIPGSPTADSINERVAALDGHVTADYTPTEKAAIDLLDDANGLVNIHDTVDTILADTNELQTDLVNGGRLDLLVDAIKAKTDNLPASPAAVGDAMTLTAAYDAAKTAAQASTAALEATLTAIKGAGWTVETLKAISDALATKAETGDLAALALQTSVDDLEGRLTATRAGYLDNLATAPPSASDIKTALEANGSKLDHLWEMTEDDGGVRRLTANALEQAPAGGGGGDAPTAEEVADAVWDEALSGHTTDGSAGAKLNSAAAAGDPLSSEVPGSYAAGTAGEALGYIDDIKVKTDTLGGASVTLVSPVTSAGNIELIVGSDYLNADSRAISISNTDGTWPVLTGATVVIKTTIGTTNHVWSGTVVTATGDTKTVRFDIQDSVTGGLTPGSYGYGLWASWAAGSVICLHAGVLNVRKVSHTAAS